MRSILCNAKTLIYRKVEYFKAADIFLHSSTDLLVASLLIPSIVLLPKSINMVFEGKKYLEQLELEIKSLNEQEESKKRFEAIEAKIKEVQEAIKVISSINKLAV